MKKVNLNFVSLLRELKAKLFVLNKARIDWFKYMYRKFPIYMLGVLSVALTNIFQIVVVRILGHIIDFFALKKIPIFLEDTINLLGKFFSNIKIENFSDKHLFIFLLLIFVITHILTMITRFGWRVAFGRQTHHGCRLLKNSIWESARLFPFKVFFDRFNKGNLMNISNSDVFSAKMIYGFTLVGVMDFLFLGSFAIYTMINIHLKLTIIILLSFSFLPIVIQKLSAREMKNYEDAQEELSKFNDISAQAVSTIRLQRLTQTGDSWEQRLNYFAENYRQKKMLAVFTSLLFFPFMGLPSLFSLSILYYCGVNYVFAGSMSVGDFIAMQGLVMLLQGPLMELGFVISEYVKGITALDRINEVYLQKSDIVYDKVEIDTNKLTIDRADFYSLSKTSKIPLIRVDCLTFKYPDSQQYVVNNLSLEIMPKDRIGILGPIGSGKSTLLRIIAGIERNTKKGTVLLLGEPFNSFTHEFLRFHIGYVPQRPFLFADSIRNNILLGNNLSDEKIWHYLEMSGIKEDVASLKDGLDTMLGEWGINLSGGQKQRLTLARALAREPKLLLLDDCLSAIDTITEEKILSNLNVHLKDSTIVWVAHRKSTLKYCNKILELNFAKDLKDTINANSYLVDVVDNTRCIQ